MVVPDLKLPGKNEFKGYITEEDIADLARRDRKIILQLSVIEQWTDWQTQTIVDLHTWLKLVDAECARRKIELAKIKVVQDEQGMVWKVIRWLTITFAAGTVAALCRWIFDKH